MKNKFPQSVFLITLVLGTLSVCVGCQSCNKSQPYNPFAMDRPTAPPPATYSYAPTYLGQQPGGYLPQSAASTYNPGTAAGPQPTSSQPASIPTNVPCPTPTPCVPTGTPIPGGTYPTTYPAATPAPTTTYPYQSTPYPTTPAPATSVPASTYGPVGSQATSPYYASGSVANPLNANNMPSSATLLGNEGSPITATPTAQTASQNLAARAGSMAMVSNTGVVSTTVGNSGMTVSSSQWVTQVGDPTVSTPPAQASTFTGQF